MRSWRCVAVTTHDQDIGATIARRGKEQLTRSDAVNGIDASGRRGDAMPRQIIDEAVRRSGLLGAGT